MRILLNEEPIEGNGQPEKAGEPPVTAEIVAKGKTERELLLERHNKKLLTVARKAVESRKTVEEQAAHTLRENELLKQNQLQQAAKDKSSWLFFES